MRKTTRQKRIDAGKTLMRRFQFATATVALRPFDAIVAREFIEAGAALADFIERNTK